MRTSAIFILPVLVLSCARLPPKPPSQAARNQLQLQSYGVPAKQTVANYTQALTGEKYKVDDTHTAHGMLIGRMKGGQIKRDVFVSVNDVSGGSRARVSVQQTQPFDLTTEQGREFFAPVLYQKIYKRVAEPAPAPAVASGKTAPVAPAANYFFQKKTAPPSRTPATK